MCTGITVKADIFGSGKGANGWFPVRQAQAYFDHPFHVQLDDAVIIDFRNEDQGPGARVAVELSPDSARKLASMILEALESEHSHGPNA